MQGLRKRDPEVLEILITRHKHRLFRYLITLTRHTPTAEDLFQDTWLKVLEKGHLYKETWRFETWLFSIARHLFIDLTRRRKNVSLEEVLESEDPLPAAEPRDTVSPYDIYRIGEDGERVAAALEKLPAGCREVLFLRFQEEMRLEEIADVVQAPLSTVKSRLYRGLEVLRCHFEEEHL